MASPIDAPSREEIIARALQKARNDGGPRLQEKLRILLLDRRIPFIPPSTEIKSLRLLGDGTFGLVELIRYEQKLYARKRPRQNTTEQRRSILDEGIKLSDISEYHPNIQRLNFIHLQTLGLVIDYCSNGALDTHVREESSTYSLTEAISWAYQLADALSFLHSKRIVHRDVKMQNILLKDNYQTLVLTDYGTATEVGKNWMTDNVGTPITMAPEVLVTNQYDERCDTYSWTIVFWQLLSKQLLPYGKEGKGFLIEVVNNKRRPPKLDHCPELLVALLYRSWHSDPNERPTLSAIKQILQIVLSVLPKTRQEYNNNTVDQLKDRWSNEYNLPDKYLPNDPRLGNEQSMNIHQEHLRVMERIMKIQKELSELEQTHKKYEHYGQLLDDNIKLERDIEALRSKQL